MKKKGDILKKHKINFSKYFGIGLAATILSIVFSWLFIDILGFKALISSTIIGIAIFLFKYVGYRKIKLIKERFVRFMIVNIIFTLAYIALSSIFIDLLKFPTLIVIPAITIVLFLLRYIAFYLSGIIIK